jgi:hypothetical protein
MQIGSDRSPPFRFLLSLVKANPSELPGIAKDERLAFLSQDQMVMSASLETGTLDTQIAAHAEMNPKPALWYSVSFFSVGFGKNKKQLLSARDRAEKRLPSQFPSDGFRVARAKDPFLRVQLHAQHILTDPWIPVFACEFNLRQLRHRRD